MRATEARPPPPSRRRSCRPSSIPRRRRACAWWRAADMPHFRNSGDIDRPLLSVTVLLALIGIAFVFSATSMASASAEHGLYLKQLIWLAVALAGGALTAAIPFRIYMGKSAWLLYGLGLVLLVMTMFVGHTGLGAQRWLGWGALKFQPSELAKVATVILLANFLSERRLDLTQLRSLLLPCLAAGIPFLLVLKQPDLGTSITFLMILFTMLYWAGLPLLYMFLLLSPVINIAASFLLPAWILFAAILSAVLYRSRL